MDTQNCEGSRTPSRFGFRAAGNGVGYQVSGAHPASLSLFHDDLRAVRLTLHLLALARRQLVLAHGCMRPCGVRPVPAAHTQMVLYAVPLREPLCELHAERHLFVHVRPGGALLTAPTGRVPGWRHTLPIAEGRCKPQLAALVWCHQRFRIPANSLDCVCIYLLVSGGECWSVVELAVHIPLYHEHYCLAPHASYISTRRCMQLDEIERL